MNMMDVLGGLLITLIVIAVVAVNLNTGFSKSKVASLEQDLVMMRMQVQQLFSGSSDYSGLDEATAIKAGVVPKSLIKGSSLKTPWGGAITLSTDSSNGSFSITLTGIPQDECTQLAKFQADAWLSVAVNGTVLNGENTIADIVDSCSATNTLTYEAR